MVERIYYIKEYNNIIHTPMKLEIKKELLTRLLIKLDVELNKKIRKEFIVVIQNVLNILDNIT